MGDVISKVCMADGSMMFLAPSPFPPHIPVNTTVSPNIRQNDASSRYRPAYSLSTPSCRPHPLPIVRPLQPMSRGTKSSIHAAFPRRHSGPGWHHAKLPSSVAIGEIARNRHESLLYLNKPWPSLCRKMSNPTQQLCKLSSTALPRPWPDCPHRSSECRL